MKKTKVVLGTCLYGMWPHEKDCLGPCKDWKPMPTKRKKKEAKK